jgi:hypothetical protein
MANTPAQRTILNLKPRSECVEGLRRYSAFFDLTMTRFLERQVLFLRATIVGSATARPAAPLPEQLAHYGCSLGQ